MNEDEKKLIEECIQSHHRMIAHHRRQIVELSRKLIREPEIQMEPLDLEIKKK